VVPFAFEVPTALTAKPELRPEYGQRHIIFLVAVSALWADDWKHDE
jgi:hypothetical protein